MSTKKASNMLSPNPATEKARKAALAEVRERIARIEAGNASSTTPAGASSAEVGAVVGVAGSPVPPAAKAKGRKGAKAKGAKPAKEPKAPKAPKEKKPKKVSGLDAAALVLAEAKTPMNMKQVFAEIQSRKLWATKGATPEATLYAAVIREIAAKGKDSRFKKHDRGLFTAAKGA
jgi:HB1, ASXL, restriction endonuclease HTH domain